MTEAHTVLVVDDFELSRALIGHKLERRGYRVIEASSGREAIEVLTRQPVDLVLLDVEMPGMDGAETLAEIRRHRDDKELPVIMATASSLATDHVAVLDLGANDSVVKPIDVDLLLARMRVHLRGRTQPRQTPPLAHEAISRSVASRRRWGVSGASPASVAEESEKAFERGAVIGQRYRIDAPIGEGGFGTVLQAYHLVLQTPVALKILHPVEMTTKQGLERFQREGISACRVRHPNAVTIYDAGTHEGFPYLVMELLAGTTLSQLLQRRRLLRLRRCAEVMAPVCDVLREAHEAGIVHRDIKPANIMLAETPRGEEVKVLDFGIATFTHVDGMTLDDEVDKTIIGTPEYMAPERFLNVAVDGAADIYSVGVTLYQALSGGVPYQGGSSLVVNRLEELRSQPRSLAKIRPDLPENLTALVMATMSYLPDARPSLERLRDELLRTAEDFEEPQWPPPTVTPSVPGLAPTVAVGNDEG